MKAEVIKAKGKDNDGKLEAEKDCNELEYFSDVTNFAKHLEMVHSNGHKRDGNIISMYPVDCEPMLALLIADTLNEINGRQSTVSDTWRCIVEGSFVFFNLLWDCVRNYLISELGQNYKLCRLSEQSIQKCQNDFDGWKSGSLAEFLGSDLVDNFTSVHV